MRVRSNKHWCLLRSVHTHPIRFNPISLNYNKTLGSNCAGFGSSVDTVQTVWIRIRIGAAFEILLLQFRSAFCLSLKKKDLPSAPMHVDLGFDRSASATPFVQVLLGVFVSGSGLHRQIWKYVPRTSLRKLCLFFYPCRRRLPFNCKYCCFA